MIIGIIAVFFKSFNKDTVLMLPKNLNICKYILWSMKKLCILKYCRNT